MSDLQNSFVESANSKNTDFPLNNLPYGVFSSGGEKRCGVAIGDYVLDVARLEREGVIDLGESLLQSAAWNSVMEAGVDVWNRLRLRLIELLCAASDHKSVVEPALIPLNDVALHMPLIIAEYTDFYAGRNHATNVGTLFRGAENALPPNWLHMPIGYNGRASSVVVSGTDIHRPWGQVKGPDDDVPKFQPSARFDIELELGAIVGQPSNGPVSVAQADDMIFGYVLLNDWSARDIQAFEYQPLGPFQGKATATTISPWIVTKAALEPFRRAAPTREVELLPHLQDEGACFYDIGLEVTMAPKDKAPTVICQTSSNQLYYSVAQQLAHHASSGCPMRVGDLLGSGTISGPDKTSYGSLLELSWGGKQPVNLDSGNERTFIEDGDTLTLQGAASGDGYKIGFGPCSGTILPALDDPYKNQV